MSDLRGFRASRVRGGEIMFKGDADPSNQDVNNFDISQRRKGKIIQKFKRKKEKISKTGKRFTTWFLELSEGALHCGTEIRRYEMEVFNNTDSKHSVPYNSTNYL